MITVASILKVCKSLINDVLKNEKFKVILNQLPVVEMPPGGPPGPVALDTTTPEAEAAPPGVTLETKLLTEGG